ncbi:MAG: hypothetical protein LBK74_10960 [Treponema sp.]|jgi:hypothetical protein|nr:hypothetical protein [Treponema sp.]
MEAGDLVPFTNISTAADYPLTAADKDMYIVVTVTRADNSGSVTSSATGPVTLPALSGPVTIGGTHDAGATLTANTGSLNGSGAFIYQWWVGYYGSTTPTDLIPGATALMYTVEPAYYGENIFVTVTRANNSGSVTSSHHVIFDPI